MNLKSVLIVCCIAGVSYSCNKTHDTLPSPQPADNAHQTISIRLGGDITLTESPLQEAKQAHNYVYAKSVLRGTMYAVDVRSDSRPFAAGLFTNPDSIVLQLPTGKSYSVTVAAVTKGSGLGPWYEEVGAGRYFERPFNRYLDNTLSYNVSDTSFLKDFTYAYTFDTDTLTKFWSYYPEMDTYTGKVDIYADSSQTVTIAMKRIAFGIRYTATNFTGGRLIVSYSFGDMHTKYLTPENIGNSLAIYTVDDFRYMDQVTAWLRILATIKWEKPDGTVVTLGSKELYPPKRNYVTTVNVTLPTSTSTLNDGVNIQLIQTNWSSTDIINL